MKQFNLGIQANSTIIHLLHNFEHLPSTLAALIAALVNDYNYAQFVGEIVHELARIDSAVLGKDTAAARSLATFLVELAIVLPKLILSNISMIVTHLDGEAYGMRSGIVQMIGKLLEGAFPQDDQSPSTIRARDALLEILLERHRDVSSYTRSRVLQTWSELQVSNCIPLSVLPEVVQVAQERLRDKTAQVRKNALHLLTTLMHHNPFSANLSLSTFERQLESVGNQFKGEMEAIQLKVRAAREEFEAKRAAEEDAEDDEEGNIDIGVEEPTLGLSPAEDAQYKKMKKQLDYYYAAIKFVKMIHDATPSVSHLLASSTSSDVLEAVQFFVIATEFGIECAGEGTKKMFVLVWSKDLAVKTSVIEAVQKLYIKDVMALYPQNKQSGAVAVASKLIGLTRNSSLAELTSLEEIVTTMTKNKSVPSAVIKALWDIFTLKLKQVSLDSCNGALTVLGFIANAKPDMVSSNLQSILDIAFDEKHASHTELRRSACIVLQKIMKRHKHGPGLSSTAQLSALLEEEQLSSLYACIESVLVDSASTTREDGVAEHARHWYAAAEQGVAALFALHPSAHTVCERICKEVALKAFDTGATVSERAVALSQLFFLLGHISIKLLVGLENTEISLKKAYKIYFEKKNEKKDAIEEDLDVGASNDYQVELMKERSETEIMGAHMIGRYAPMVIEVCSHPDKYSDDMLQSSAVLALCKFMCVNSQFCDEHMQLLITVLSKAEDPCVRANVIVALGDMAFRFPNVVEPWSEYMYERLNDEDLSVRNNTIMVMSHLILNDMMKVKGPVSEIAKCLEDENTRIADFARLFFKELSTRGKNPIYNVLPDTLSRISTDEKVTKKQFQSIMKHLLQFIVKDKQIESLTEKFCLRFNDKSNVRQAQDVAFCLAQLNINDKGMAKLVQHYKIYKVCCFVYLYFILFYFILFYFILFYFLVSF